MRPRVSTPRTRTQLEHDIRADIDACYAHRDQADANHNAAESARQRRMILVLTDKLRRLGAR